MTEHNHEREQTEMTVSHQLNRLAARTKELEERAAAAHQKARVDLEHEVAAARDESKANAEALRRSVDADAAEGLGLVDRHGSHLGRAHREDT
jgi:hypothetical protein